MKLDASMGKSYSAITPQLAEWLERQHMFFVATAPLSGEGLVNCSPKGLDTFRIFGPREVGYLDLVGSGVETIAHVRENGRMVFMFCAFNGPPKIVRLQGKGDVVTPDHADYEQLATGFPRHAGERAIFRCRLTRISDSCGFGVPVYDYGGQRDTLTRWAEAKGPDALDRYQREKNSRSVDGLPGLDLGS